MSEELKIDEKIQLHNTVMIIGLSGWGNAGEVSTYTIRYLADKLSAKKLGVISPELFHNYQIQRPMVSIKQGVIQSYVPPKNDLFYWSDEDNKLSLTLLLGSEPHFNWPRYTRTILTLAEKLNVRQIFTIGGYLADIHHESDPLITASTNNKKLKNGIKRVKAEFTDYQGPTSVYSEIHWEARQRGIDVVSLWCAVPIYVRALYPKAVLQIIKKVTILSGINVDLIDLMKIVESFEVQFSKETLNFGLEKEPTYMI